MAQINLRPLTEADLPQCVIWRSDPEVMQFLIGEAADTTLASVKEWFARAAVPATREIIWAIEADNCFIGCCSLHLETDKPTAAFGIYIGDKNFWGQGYGGAAVRETLRIGFDEMGLHRIHLDAFAGNVRAIRCYEKCGFRHEGIRIKTRRKSGQWLDAVLMAILREEWESLNTSGQEGLTPIGPEHLSEVLAVWQAAELWPHTAEYEQLIAGALARNRDMALGWRVGGKLVATAIGSFDGLRGWVQRVAVLPEYRRQGIAAALVEAVEEKLWQAGAGQINLMVFTANTEARTLYEKLGYEYCDVKVMRKRFQQ